LPDEYSNAGGILFDKRSMHQADARKTAGGPQNQEAERPENRDLPLSARGANSIQAGAVHLAFKVKSLARNNKAARSGPVQVRGQEAIPIPKIAVSGESFLL
jgi:hypothetical protein